VAEPGAGVVPFLSVVVPTRNEAGNVVPLLERLAAALRRTPYEVLFVDDSTDTTPNVISAAAEQPELGTVRLIHRPPTARNGLSGAVVEGIAAARGNWVCVMDADLQHPPEAVAQLLTQAERTGADLIVASRRADFIGPVGLSRARAMTSQVLTVLARGLFPRVLKNVSDPLTGFFLVRRETLDLAMLQPEGFKILLEILVRHPELHVSEIFFDFAPRQEGQSKADLNEGVRYFRHVTRLRWSVNNHLARFLLVILLAVGANLLLLAALLGGLGWALLPAAALAGAVTVACLLVGEAWVFADRAPGYTRRRLALTLLLSSLYLLLVYLPLLLLMDRLGLPTWLAALLSLSIAGFVYYLFSEYWIWTRGLMMQPRSLSYYDVHGLLAIASQVPLPDLEAFRVPDEPAQVDLQIRVDRHGMPQQPPGALSYEEHLGRLGFGLTVMPGDYTEIVVAPLLESSPAFLYTNVVEPVIHWMLVTRGYAFPRLGAVARPPGLEPGAAPAQAMLLAGIDNMAFGLAQIASQRDLAFMGDDRVILDVTGLVYAYAKPVTVNQALLSGAPAATRAVAPLFLQRLIYSPRVRQLGLWLGARRLPAATVNTYLQRLMPQPKYDLQALAPRLRTVTRATADSLFLRGGEPAGQPEALIDDFIVAGWAGGGFEPLAQLLTALAGWDGEDWISREQHIAQHGLADTHIHTITTTANWWEAIEPALQPPATLKTPEPASLTPRQT
jgi:glycosyltransferase involved in cell wall biosynthesis